MSDNAEAGFSLAEISVALTLIALAILGTLSTISTNRALAEAAWLTQRLSSVSRAMLDNVEMRYLSGDDFSTFDLTHTYSWGSDSFGLRGLLSDNGLATSGAVLRITPSSDAAIDYVVSLSVTGAGGRQLAAQRMMRTPLQ